MTSLILINSLIGNDTHFDTNKDILDCNNDIIINYKMIEQKEDNKEIYYLIYDKDNNKYYLEFDCRKIGDDEIVYDLNETTG